jgi:hypothetical protein
MVSDLFKAAVKLSDLKSYEIANKAGIHYTTLSQIINGVQDVKPGDKRVLKVAKILGLEPEDCFDDS